MNYLDWYLWGFVGVFFLLRQILKSLSFHNGRKGALWNNKGTFFTFGDKHLGRCGLVPMAESKTGARLFYLGNPTAWGIWSQVGGVMCPYTGDKAHTPVIRQLKSQE